MNEKPRPNSAKTPITLTMFASIYFFAEIKGKGGGGGGGDITQKADMWPGGAINFILLHSLRARPSFARDINVSHTPE
jgi:hypothetical protein